MSSLRSLNTALRNSRGQAVVETALVLPIVLILTLALVSSLLILRAHIAVQDAASHAARRLSITGNASLATMAFSEYLSRSGLPGVSGTDFTVVEASVTSTTVVFSVVYWQRSYVPWVDRMLWDVPTTTEGVSKAGHASLRAVVFARRE